jgi:hypothetical protein
MITEKQKEAVKELCQYVDNFCKENNLSAFMSVAASEDHPDGLEQIAGSIITGKGGVCCRRHFGDCQGRQPCLYAAFHGTHAGLHEKD